MLRWRLLLGTLFIAALVGLVWGDARLAAEGQGAGWLLVPLALVITVGATQEFLAMVRLREPQIAGPAVYLGNLAIVAAPWAAVRLGRPESDGQVGAYAIAVLAVVLLEIVRYDKDVSKRVIERLALSVLGLTYIGLLMSFIIRLRLSPYGLFPLVSMLVVVKMGDTGAYTVGRLIGRHKLAPKLSPGKTIEGLAGGILFSMLGMGLAAYFFPFVEFARSRFLGWMLYAGIVCLVGVAGDLIESLLKRDFGRKDSSDWLPGFGGVLDLVDSPLLAAPVAWMLWESGLLDG